MSADEWTPDFTRNFLRIPRGVLRELWSHPTALRVYQELPSAAPLDGSTPRRLREPVTAATAALS
jgi:hypothetical protein